MHVPLFFAQAIPAVPAATDTYVEVKCGNRGRLGTVVIKQTSGTLAGYEWELYNSEAGAKGTGDYAKEIYSITGTQTVANLAAVGAIRNQVIPFRSIDDRALISNAKSESIWLRIKTVSTGAKDFEFSITPELVSAS